MYLKPESQILVDHYRANAAEYNWISDALRFPSFSRHCRAELTSLLGSTINAELIESVTRVGDFANSSKYWVRRSDVSRILKSRGLKLRRGKRTAPGLLELVQKVAPLLLYFGLPLASSERSPFIRALRLITGEVGIEEDPRNVVRMFARQDKASEAQVDALIREVMAECFRIY